MYVCVCACVRACVRVCVHAFVCEGCYFMPDTYVQLVDHCIVTDVLSSTVVSMALSVMVPMMCVEMCHHQMMYVTVA